MLGDAFFVGLPDCDDRISRKLLKFHKEFFGHLTDTIFIKPRIFVRGKHDMTFCSGTISKIIPLTARLRSFVASDQLTDLLNRKYYRDRHRESGTRTYTTFKASAVRVIPGNQQ